jgi:hypothetical protein
MIISKAHALVGTTKFTAVIVESVYDGEMSTNDSADSSGYLDSRDAAQEWALKELGTRAPLRRVCENADGTRTEVEFWAEVSEWTWEERAEYGVLDAEENEVNRQYGYPDEGGTVEWTDPEKP